MSNALLADDPAARPVPLTPMPGRALAHVVIVQHTSVEEEADTVAAFIGEGAASDIPGTLSSECIRWSLGDDTWI